MQDHCLHISDNIGRATLTLFHFPASILHPTIQLIVTPGPRCPHGSDLSFHKLSKSSASSGLVGLHLVRHQGTLATWSTSMSLAVSRNTQQSESRIWGLLGFTSSKVEPEVPTAIQGYGTWTSFPPGAISTGPQRTMSWVSPHRDPSWDQPVFSSPETNDLVGLMG